jgi:hypothetical protein
MRRKVKVVSFNNEGPINLYQAILRDSIDLFLMAFEAIVIVAFLLRGHSIAQAMAAPILSEMVTV